MNPMKHPPLIYQNVFIIDIHLDVNALIYQNLFIDLLIYIHRYR